MCDFQYLPVQRTAGGSYTEILSKVIIDRLIPLKEYMSRDMPLFIPPNTFARVDRPCDVNFLYKSQMTHRNAGYVDPDKSRPSNYIGTSK